MLSVVLFTLLVVYENVLLDMVWRVRHPTVLDVDEGLLQPLPSEIR